jgi:predicted GNAT superfamily acetyltransferase
MGSSETEVMTEISIRPLSTHDELREAVRLQKVIWGFADYESLPLRLFVVATKIGGQVYGAFDGSKMIAYCLAIPGVKPGAKAYLHSHMLGVLPEYQNLHIGRTLKLEQRKDAIARGLELIEWTFDPLEIKNAYFNIVKLGAVVRRFVLNYYGTTTSHLHGGLPTDRCFAEWWLRSKRVETVLAGSRPDWGRIEERIAVPAGIAQIRADDNRRAREIQKSISERFIEYFGRGLAVVGFERSEQAGTYLFGQWKPE